MEFLSGSSPMLLQKLQALGHDPESLHYISQEFFTLCDQLGYNARQSADLFIRIKRALETVNGSYPADLILYENNRYNPTRLCIENKTTGKSLFFRIVPGQTLAEKKNLIYSCEHCSTDYCIKRSEAKEHFLQYHNH